MAMTDWDQCLQQLSAGIRTLNVRVSVAQRELLIQYLQELVTWNQTYNLTAIRDPQQMVVRHLLDSLAVLPDIQGKRLADIGSGAGLPGVVLAIVRPKLAVTVVESIRKKAAFLRHVRRRLALDNLTVMQERVEQYQPQQPYDIVISRAFASAVDAIELSGHLLAPNGLFMLMKGRHPQTELEAVPAGYRIQAIKALDIPGLDAQRHLAILETGLI